MTARYAAGQVLTAAEMNAMLPVANSTSATNSTVTPDPVSGANSMTVVEVPADQAVIAIKITGDAHPRWLLASDPADGLFFGDGTVDPYTSGVNIYLSGGTDLGLTAQPGKKVIANPDFQAATISIAGFGHMRAGTGVPSNGVGSDGDFFFRQDGAGGSCIYHKQTGAWVAVA